MIRFIIRDLLSDLSGGYGLYLSVTPLIQGLTSFVQLIAGLGGIILLYFSIKYKIELIKEKRMQNEQNKKSNEANMGGADRKP